MDREEEEVPHSVYDDELGYSSSSYHEELTDAFEEVLSQQKSNGWKESENLGAPYSLEEEEQEVYFSEQCLEEQQEEYGQECVEELCSQDGHSSINVRKRKREDGLLEGEMEEGELTDSDSVEVCGCGLI